jgi:UDP-glucose 4-epimerase
LKVLITGAAGFIGTNLRMRLRELNIDYVGIDDFSNAIHTKKNEEVLKVSILNKSALAHVVQDCNSVIHLAALGSVPRSMQDPSTSININTIGTLNLLELIKNTDKKFILASSSSVYGHVKVFPITETQTLNPISPYGASKAAAELIVSGMKNAFNIDATTFRFFNVYGPYQRSDSEYAAVIPRFINSFLSNSPIVIYGDGYQSRDFTYVDDVVNVLISSLKVDAVLDQTYNLAFGNSRSLLEIIKILKDLTGLDIKIIYNCERRGDIKFSQASPQKILDNFEIQKITTLELGLKKTYEYFINYNL